jgi:ABC-type phosphate transport system substrate-binding protein
MNRVSVAGMTALCLSALGLVGTAHAAPCSALPNPLIVSGSSAVQPVIAKVAPKLSAATGADQISVVYKSSGSCSGVTQLGLDTTPTGACAAGACLTGTAQYWDSTGTMQMCDLESAGTHIDLILSDVYKSSCAGVTNANLVEENLLVLPFGFIVPTASSETAIDAREAYYVYGKGMSANVTPWTNETALFRRNNGSGTQITIYKHLNIPVGSTIGTEATGTGDMITKVATSSAPTAALGFAGLDSADTKRSMIKILAYRHYKQDKFYWADSSSTTFDKKNVRDGHYPLWGYEHAVTLTGSAQAARSKAFADILSGKVALPGGDAILEESKAGVVPLCAMDVSRATDAGDFALVSSGDSCTCFFEKNAGPSGGATSCTSCTTNADCSGGKVCRKTYCEAR